MKRDWSLRFKVTQVFFFESFINLFETPTPIYKVTIILDGYATSWRLRVKFISASSLPHFSV